MVQAGTNGISVSQAEQDLRAELARSDLALGSIAPVLRHLLTNADHSLFSGEVVARVRGMLGDLARQLLAVEAEEAGEEDPLVIAQHGAHRLVGGLAGDAALLGHMHALAIEWQLTETLQARDAIDASLSPLLQTQIASRDPGAAEVAMATLAAQVRFMQQARRMELPLGELSAELFHAALEVLRNHSDRPDAAVRTVARLREEYDEGHSRLGLISRLITGLGATAMAALEIERAGVALFLSALALASVQERDLVVLSTSSDQLARLSVALQAAGVKREQAAAQMALLQPEATLPDHFDAMTSNEAAAMLASIGGA